MVDLYHPALLTCLVAAHEEKVPASASMHRQLASWQRALRGQLAIYPGMTWACLGWHHVHLIIEEPADEWFTFPWALGFAWLSRGFEASALYLHCVLPMSVPHASIVDGFVPGAQVTMIVTGDGWQSVAPLQDRFRRDGTLRDTGEALRPAPFRKVSLQEDLVRSYPLLLPLLCEQGETWASLPDLWRRVYDRLGEGVWRYLPRGTRRLPHNGKTYLRHARDLLVQSAVFRQNAIRYAALGRHCAEIFLVLGAMESPLDCIRRASVILESYERPDGTLFVRAIGGVALLHALLTPECQAARSGIWILDAPRTHREERRVRVRYEELLDHTGACRR